MYILYKIDRMKGWITMYIYIRLIEWKDWIAIYILYKIVRMKGMDNNGFSEKDEESFPEKRIDISTCHHEKK